MYYYKMFDLILKSNVVIEQLVEVNDCDNYDVEIRLGNIPDEIVKHMEEVDDEIRIYVDDNYMWMRNTYANFAVYPDGRIYSKAITDTTDLNLLQFVLGYCMAMYVQYKNMLAIHCGSVIVDGKGIIISGTSGAGKSTITTSFIEDGAMMIADDIAVVRGDGDVVEILSGFPQQKLCRDAAIKKGYNLDELVYIDPVKDKFAINRHDKFVSEPTKLSAMFMISKYDPEDASYKTYEGKIVVNEVKGFDKVALVKNQMFLLMFLDMTGLKAEQFKVALEIGKRIPIYSICRPENVDTLDEIKKTIRDILSKID